MTGLVKDPEYKVPWWMKPNKVPCIKDYSDGKARKRGHDRWFAKQRRKGRREDHELSPDSGWTWGHEPGNNWEDWGP